MVIIGSKFQGKQAFIDTTNGVYWESMPTVDAFTQRALLSKPQSFLSWFKEWFNG